MRSRGFTLIELIATVVILSIILTITVPGVKEIINASHQTTYELNLQNMKVAAKNYALRKNIRLEDGNKRIITIEDMIDGAVLDEIKCPKTKELCEGYVVISQNSDKYSFDPYLKCSNNYITDNYGQADIINPVVTILGDNPASIFAGNTYNDAGATATDDIDGDITNKIIVTSTVNPKYPGTYTVTYTVKDTSSNQTTARRTVHVIDNTGPIITFEPTGDTNYAKSKSTIVTVTDTGAINNDSLKYVWTTSLSQPGVTEFTTAFTNKQTITTPSGATGSYYLWIMASDNSNNETITSSNAFNLDNTKPVITLNGENNITINKGSVYNDPGATATDNVDTSVTVTSEGTVNPNIEGTYTITYYATDSSSNEAVPVTRTVVVKYVFICGDTITDTRDNKQYATVKIGTQCWFKKDLQYNKDSCLSKSWDEDYPHNACRFNDSSTYPSYHYQWEVAKIACPAGWHLPTDAEWKILEMYLGMTQAQADATGWRGTDQGTKLKTSAWGGNNSSSFTALPVGYRSIYDSLSGVGSFGYWWSSSPSDSDAWRRFLYSGNSTIGRNTSSQAYGSSVRCLLGQ